MNGLGSDNKLNLNLTFERKSGNSYFLTLYLIEMPFKAFANRADTDQTALVRAA